MFLQHRIVKYKDQLSDCYWVQERAFFLIFPLEWINVGNGDTLDDAKDYLKRFKASKKPQVIYEEYV